MEKRRGSGDAAESWVEAEVAGGHFADERHGQRLRRLLEQFSDKVGAPTPWACQDWGRWPGHPPISQNEAVPRSSQFYRDERAGVASRRAAHP